MDPTDCRSSFSSSSSSSSSTLALPLAFIYLKLKCGGAGLLSSGTGLVEDARMPWTEARFDLRGGNVNESPYESPYKSPYKLKEYWREDLFSSELRPVVTCRLGSGSIIWTQLPLSCTSVHGLAEFPRYTVHAMHGITDNSGDW